MVEERSLKEGQINPGCWGLATFAATTIILGQRCYPNLNATLQNSAIGPKASSLLHIIDVRGKFLHPFMTLKLLISVPTTTYLVESTPGRLCLLTYTALVITIRPIERLPFLSLGLGPV